MTTDRTADTTDTTAGERPPKWRIVGPGLVVAATGVGAADLVATLVAGAKFGYTLLWVAVLGAVIKVVLVEGAGRYSLATGRTIFEGWRSLGRWTTWYFAPYIVIWGLVYGATAMSSSALPLVALFPDLSLRWTAMAIGVVGLVLVWFGTYASFEKIMALLVGVMFVTVVGAALLATPNLGEIALGLRPIFPDDSVVNVLAIAGGVGGTITLAAYGYWLREKGWSTPAFMRVMRIDNAVAYVVTGVFVVAMLVVGAELYYSMGIAAETGDQALVQLSGILDERYGEVFGKVFLLGFFASSFSSLIGVWSGVSLMFADYVGNLRELPSGHPDTRTGGRFFRAYMLWLTFPPMLLLLLDEPIGLILAYGTLGALFMPFLAITLLVLLNKRREGALPHSDVPAEWRNGWISNGLLALCAVLFLALGINELRGVISDLVNLF
ncbi:iron transporter [Nocardioides psychrotolerans]|uniref:Nramp family divalent metal transporter n=1 Tax=Nocardioides psychrotolerans TaxID=1005945 RepID=UPI000B870066|nr:Nramp family divalent metal transporter [Nocardioides psychrotolerans]GEP39270.1 iron transporter [Nocardioides psychrotolerans]